MLNITPQNATDTKITVTNSATLLYSLMDTASSTKNVRKYYSDKYANAVRITPEDGDIRILFKGTPTATVGEPLSSGTTTYFPGVELDELKLIRQGGSDVAVTVVIYKSEPSESPTCLAYDITLEASSVNIGDVDIASNATDFATATLQGTGNTSLATIAGDTTSLDGKDFATQTTLAVVAGDTTSIDGKITACDTTNLATSALQLPDGHNVTIDNAAGGSAVNIQDGGNTITVDNDGTFAVQSTLAAGTAIAGKVYITDGTDDAQVVAANDDSVDLEDTNGLVTNSVLNARISNTAVRPLRADSATNTLQTISYEHHEIHAGSTFECSEVNDIAINNVVDIQITTPNTTKWAHLTFDFTTESETEYYLYENVTINVAGTSCTAYNKDRNSGTTATTTVAHIENTSVANANSDTAVAGATAIMHGISGSKNQETGTSDHDHEIILKQNEDYSLRFIATAAGYITWHLTWYEHTNKS